MILVTSSIDEFQVRRWTDDENVNLDIECTFFEKSIRLQILTFTLLLKM